MNRQTVLTLGFIATFCATLAVGADIFSIWTGEYLWGPLPEAPRSAIVGINDVKHVMLAKNFADLQIGSILGQFIIPLHGVLMFLVFCMTKDSYPRLSVFLLCIGLYVAALGAGFHGSLIYSFAVVKAGDQALVDAIAYFFDLQRGVMVALILTYSALLAAIIALGRTKYPRWMSIFSPLGLIIQMRLVNALVPDTAHTIKEFISVAGFNFPMTVFSILTTYFFIASLNKQRQAPA